MNRIVWIPLAIVVWLSYSNCAKVQMTPVEETNQGSLGTPQDPKQIYSNCDQAKETGRLQKANLQLQFDNQNRTCEWGKNGNKTILNGSVRARAENIQTAALPSDAKVCQVKLAHKENAAFQYDDNILVTLNGKLLAATTDFQKHFVVMNEIYSYSWSGLVDKPAQFSAEDSTPNKQYCYGRSQQLSNCFFPPTETVGNIKLEFNERAIQNILAATSQNQIQIGFITTGDNDSSDCQHTPVTLLADVYYYR
jgi:hypothetical protein